MKHIFTLMTLLAVFTEAKAKMPAELLGNSDSIFQFKLFKLDSLPKKEYNCWMTESNSYTFRFDPQQVEAKNLIVKVMYGDQTTWVDTTGEGFIYPCNKTGVYRIILVNKLKATTETKVAQAQRVIIPETPTMTPEEAEEERRLAERRAKRDAEKAKKSAEKSVEEAKKVAKEPKEKKEKTGKEAKEEPSKTTAKEAKPKSEASKKTADKKKAAAKKKKKKSSKKKK